MNTAKGLVGIRRFLADQAYTKGWHVILGDDYIGYDSIDDAHQIADKLYREHGPVQLEGWTGNGLHFIKIGNRS